MEIVLHLIEDEEARMWKKSDDDELRPAIHGEQWRKRREQEKVRASRGSGGGCGGRSGARLCAQRGAGDRSRGGGRVVSMHGRHAPATCPTVESFCRTRVG